MTTEIETRDPVGLHTLEVVSGADRFNRWMYGQFRKYLKGDVLEIGSGIGSISAFVISDGYPVTLSDYNDDYCRLLENKFSANPQVKAVMNIDLLDEHFDEKFSAHKEAFDSIFMLNVIEHIRDDRRAVRNCSFLLKPGGHLVLLAPAGSWLYNRFDRELGHFRRYSVKSMARLLADNDFTLLSSRRFNVAGMAGWLLYGKILGRKMLGKTEMSFFEKIVPFAKMLDKLVRNKTGLSIIVTGVKT